MKNLFYTFLAILLFGGLSTFGQNDLVIVDQGVFIQKVQNNP